MKRTLVQYGPNNCGKERIGEILVNIGGTAPNGFTPFANEIIAFGATDTITFQGSGLEMTLSSDYFAQNPGREYWMFIYDNHTGALIEQFDLGAADNGVIVAPSLFQNGFSMPGHRSGAIGYTFQLAYTYGSGVATTHAP